MTTAFLIAADGARAEMTPIRENDTIRLPGIPAGYDYAELELDGFSGKAGEDGWFLLPSVPARNRPAALVRFTEKPDHEDLYRVQDLPVFGVRHGQRATLAVVTGMAITFQLVCGVRQGQYRLAVRFPLEGHQPYETPEVRLLELEGAEATVSGLARRYRRHQLERGACRPLRERLADQPVLAEELRSLEVRLRHCWKPVPPPVLEQTPENEPPLTVAITFDRAGDILDRCHAKGIRHAEFCLVGWNKSGHDGRFPDLFPVEPKLGGEEALRRLIDKAHAYGYLITCHTNLFDSYTISSRLDHEDWIRNRDGSPMALGQWGGGQSRLLCPKPAYEHYAIEDMERLAALGFHGQHYFDVLSIVEPHACHHPDHPLTPREAGEWRCRALRLARRRIGATASEGGLDFCAGDLDYVLYAQFELNPKHSPLVDEFVPFWFIVYHGIQLYNAACETVNAMVKDDPTLMLRNIELGGRPTGYFHSKFLTTGNNWMGNQDLRCATDEELEFGTDRLALAERQHQALADLQLEFIDDIAHPQPDVAVTTYSNGTRVVINYGNEPLDFEGHTIPPLDFLRLDA